MWNVQKWSDTLQQSSQQILQDFLGVSDHFGTFYIKGLKVPASEGVKGVKLLYLNEINKKIYYLSAGHVTCLIYF